MKEPLQIVNSESEFSLEERALVAAGRQVVMPAETRAHVWAKVAAAGAAGGGALATIVAAKTTAAAAASTTAATTGSGLAALASWKGLVVLVVLGGGVAAYQIGRHDLPVPAPTAMPASGRSSAASTLPLVPRQAQPVAPDLAQPDPRANPAPPTTAHPSGPRVAHPSLATPRPDEEAAATPASRLAEESRAVLAARQALRAGDATECLRLLEEARARFPDGALAQERAALNILALAKSGQRERAAKMAERFLQEHPESPHAADIRQITR